MRICPSPRADKIPDFWKVLLYRIERAERRWHVHEDWEHNVLGYHLHQDEYIPAKR